MSMPFVRVLPPDKFSLGSYYANMAKHVGPDWFLVEWMQMLNLQQADVQRATGWSKAKVSDLYNGVQPYKRDIVNALSSVLNIRPFELLMHPDDAMAFRRMRAASVKIAADTAAIGDEDIAPIKKRA